MLNWNLLRAGRRQVDVAMRIVLAAFVLFFASFPSAGGNAQAPLRKVDVVSHKPYVIATLGDSLGDGLWEGVYRHAVHDKRISVRRGSRRSVGFADSDLTHQIDALVKGGPIDAFLVMVGANDDGRSFFVNGRANALFGTARWREQYKLRVSTFMAHVAPLNVPLVWLLLPVLRTPDMNKAASIINDLVVEAAAQNPHVVLVPTHALTSDPKGGYVTHFNDLQGRLRLMRLSDGLHFTEPGYSVLAHHALARLSEVSGRFRAIAGTAPAPQMR